MIIERIFRLIENSGLSAHKIAKECNITTKLMSDWKAKRCKPSADAIIKLAEYFNVTTDYLLTGKKQQMQLIQIPKELEEVYNSFPDEFYKKEFIGYAKGYRDRVLNDIEKKKKNID